MPQMSPLNWWTLMIYFIILFMIFHSLTYFMFTYSPPMLNSKKKNSINSFNWTW